ncbi:UNVERIFIED_CONTAM: hypothetical protein Sradi_1558300 [Sesamum radiatum]|uniref:Uncharacterized protein n=1 Tax=Sesamum radiatum TaxID=300843 RepID=A0AAW2UCL6_SESRA
MPEQAARLLQFSAPSLRVSPSAAPLPSSSTSPPTAFMEMSVSPGRQLDDIEPPPPVPTSDPTTLSMLKLTCSFPLIRVLAPSPMVPP